MIEIENFTFRYREGAQPAVSDVNLSISDGAFVGIIGAAGSGKSTLTYAMNGIVPHCYPGDFYGSVRVGGLDTCECELTQVSRMVGSVCQDIDSQMVSTAVEDEMLYGLENFGVPKPEIEPRVADALDAMGIADLRSRAIDSLSGGQKQKVAIASILALRPRVLVLDEPTAELDPASSVAVFDLLARYAREHGTTVVAVEQKIALLSEYADMLVVMDGGRVRYAAPPAEVLSAPGDLLALGVNCPRSTTLMSRLHAAGVYAGPVCRNVSQAVRALESLLAVPATARDAGAPAGAENADAENVGARRCKRAGGRTRCGNRVSQRERGIRNGASRPSQRQLHHRTRRVRGVCGNERRGEIDHDAPCERAVEADGGAGARRRRSHDEPQDEPAGAQGGFSVPEPRPPDLLQHGA